MRGGLLVDHSPVVGSWSTGGYVRGTSGTVNTVDLWSGAQKKRGVMCGYGEGNRGLGMPWPVPGQI